MNPRTHSQPYLNNSLMIRQEIQRFESVHPSIYAIYDLIEAIPDVLITQQIREHVVCIEDSFVNSQEWTLARAVPDLKLGIVGSIQSGKSALVHRYLTGSYMQEESPEGGRFKKEFVNDGQSYLLLIRDEGGPPELQFTHWVDAVIFVFSLENEMSFNAIYSYYAKMAHYRNTNEIPLILVGTQDGISETSPRVIDDTRARKLANDLRKCAYYETCATYGLNVERVFQDACAKIAQQRQLGASPSNSRSNTPNHSIPRNYFSSQSQKPFDTHSTGSQSSGGSHTPPSAHTLQQNQGSAQNQAVFKTPVNPDQKQRSMKESKTPPQQIPHSHMQLQVHPHGQTEEQAAQERLRIARELPGPDLTPMLRRKSRKVVSNVTKSNSFSQHGLELDRRDHPHFNPNASRLSSSLPNYYKGSVDRDVTPTSTPILSRKSKHKASFTDKMDTFMKELQIPSNSPLTPILTRVNRVRSSLTLERSSDKTDQPTPSSTPTQNRKNRRRSNIFTPNKKEEDLSLGKDGKGKKLELEKEVGSGRAIPIKQGYLYKKSTKGLNKEWKKKYVTLCDNGVLSYHPNLHDYMDNTHGKEISLMQTTVKIPGMKPKGSRSPATNPNTNGTNGDVQGKENFISDQSPQRMGTGDDAYIISNSSLGIANGIESTINIAATTAGTRIQTNAKIETPNVKKRHKRAKSNAKTDSGSLEDSDGYEFMIVSLQNQQWFFEAPTVEERDEWVSSIEQQILSSLQGIMSSKSQTNQTKTDPAAVKAIRNTAGNMQCVDCASQNPDWASLNLGALMCIECSGIHRNLGTHLSRVRSLDLDEWPPELTTVMTSIGNRMANTIWEANIKGQTKPGPQTAREEKEKWIRAKYEQKEFLPHLPLQDHSTSQQLIDAVARQDIPFLILLLAYATDDNVNAPYSNRDTRTPLHIAAALGNIVLLQLLLWYGANVKTSDQEGRTALWFARSIGAQDCVELLLANDCPEHGIPLQRRPSQTSKTSDVFDKLPASVI